MGSRVGIRLENSEVSVSNSHMSLHWVRPPRGRCISDRAAHDRGIPERVHHVAHTIRKSRQEFNEPAPVGRPPLAVEWKSTRFMASRTLDEHIEVTPDIAGGKPRIRGHRITVQDIAIWRERLGKSSDEIASEYDLTLGDVHAALAYYLDHREEIDARSAEDRAFADALRTQTPSKRSQKLKSLRGEN